MKRGLSKPMPPPKQSKTGMNSGWNLSAGRKKNENQAKTETVTRAPDQDIYLHYSNHLSNRENQTMLKLQLEVLLGKVHEDMKTIHPNRGRALTKDAVFLIFLICKNLKLTDGTKFAAIEIYDRFMITYNENLLDELRKIDKSVLWEFSKRLKNQALLRIVSCIQLASKVYSDSNQPFVSSLQVKRILQQFKKCYTLEGVNSSEARVMKLLNQKLKYVNSLEIIECILLSLDLGVESYQKAYDLAVHILEYTCEEHEKIYEIYLKNSTSKFINLDKKTFQNIEFNKAFEAAGIVACTLFVVRTGDHKHFLPIVGKISRVQVEDFIDLAAVLISLLYR